MPCRGDTATQALASLYVFACPCGGRRITSDIGDIVSALLQPMRPTHQPGGCSDQTFLRTYTHAAEPHEQMRTGMLQYGVSFCSLAGELDRALLSASLLHVVPSCPHTEYHTNQRVQGQTRQSGMATKDK